MYQEKNPIPASRAWVYPNQQVSVSFKEHFDDLDKCTLLNPEVGTFCHILDVNNNYDFV